jgi:hypothetical protein
MVRRVADAIRSNVRLSCYDARCSCYGADERLACLTGGTTAEDLARAAIEAMREPTEEMLRDICGHPRDELVADWEYMIDAALKPPNCP